MYIQLFLHLFPFDIVPYPGPKSSIDNSKPPTTQASILDEDTFEEAETNPKAQPGVKLALKPSEPQPH